jgi:hypothetical protein
MLRHELQQATTVRVYRAAATINVGLSGAVFMERATAPEQRLRLRRLWASRSPTVVGLDREELTAVR